MKKTLQLVIIQREIDKLQALYDEIMHYDFSPFRHDQEDDEIIEDIYSTTFEAGQSIQNLIGKRYNELNAISHEIEKQIK